MERHLRNDDPTQKPPGLSLTCHREEGSCSALKIQQDPRAGRLTVLIVLLGCDLEEEVTWATVCRTPGVPKRSRPLLTRPLGGRQTARVVSS